VHPLLFHIGLIQIPSYGAMAAVGVLCALFLAQHTALRVGLDAAKVWNLCVAALFAALVGSRLLVIVVNWNDLRKHPLWLLGLAMVHHPLVAAAGGIAAVVAAGFYVVLHKMSLRAVADVLAAPLALAAAFEQFGALMAGSGYGIETGDGFAAHWAVTYEDPLAARWSGAPLGVPVHPAQAYAAFGFLALALFLLVWLPRRSNSGDVAGIGLMGAGVIIYVSELFRDFEGRGVFLKGAVDGPQLAAVGLVFAGAALMLRAKRRQEWNEAVNGG
jgi:phosphatidylglycerol:prolipoprotein diacylglycerol transferase